MTGLLGHLVIAPVLLPLFSAAVIVALGDQRRAQACRAVSLGNCVALSLASVYLLGWAATGQPAVYALGDWPAPYGIVLVLDRLSALMVAVTSLLSVAVAWYAIGGWDRRGRHFHALLQLQLMGLNGAFLTGDLFNLFVFFEVLLIASYGLMLHGGGVARQRATLHYVVYNLVASTLFLFSVSLLYALTGTLNMADLALQIAAAPPDDAALLQSAGLMLLVVFAVKAAVLPLGFWLQSSYSAASPPVACLFAVMTKVGVYSILRVSTLMFGDEAGVAANLAAPWVLPLGVMTLAVASAGALASRDLTVLATYLVVASVGSMLVAAGMFSQQGIAAALFYLVHSTFALALLFLLAGEAVRERGALAGALLPGAPLRHAGRLAAVYLLAAVAVSGLPPLSGYIAKIGILQSLLDGPWLVGGWTAVLGSSLIVVIALARFGSMLFWHTTAVSGVAAVVATVGADTGQGGAGLAAAPLVTSRAALQTDAPPAVPAPFGPVLLLATIVLALTVGARPVSGYLASASEQLLNPQAYIEAVIRGDGRDDPDERNVDGDRLRAGAPALVPGASRMAAAAVPAQRAALPEASVP
jgi:multicomponent K+:H+ antiporter subunit D